MNEWNQFKVVGQPAIGNGFNPTCRQFDTIYHTSHVEQALGIIKSGGIRPYIVSDESKLNDKRIEVSWLSPNHWTTGYWYGNIRFQFPFSALIANKKLYWVEAISYNIAAPRILITDHDRSSEFPSYHPTAKDGPWWFDMNSGRHYFNSAYCLEFMFEHPINLSELIKIDFVDHNEQYCSLNRYNPSSCSELGSKSGQGGAWFITRAIVTGVDLSTHGESFTYQDRIAGNNYRTANNNLGVEFNNFCQKFAFNNDLFVGNLKSTDPRAEAVMKGVMSHFTFHSLVGAKDLASFFSSEDDFSIVAAKLFASAVGSENWKYLMSWL